MTTEEIEKRFMEIKKEMESEDLFDDLTHPYELMESLVYLCENVLKLVKK